MDSTLDILATFPAFSPYSAGSYEDKAQVTIQAINHIFHSFGDLLSSFGKAAPMVSDIGTISSSEDDLASAAALKGHFDRQGSDKATLHDYHQLYGHILNQPERVTGICEIGMGTNNTDVVSNMGEGGRPGASLRAFRDYCPKAMIYGADIDRRILFEEDRIWTGFVDQTDPESVDTLAGSLPNDLDLIIDDGLHSPLANLNTLRLALSKTKVGGWAVIEDISPAAVRLWECMSMVLPNNFQSHIFSARGGVVFGAKRIS